MIYPNPMPISDDPVTAANLMEKRQEFNRCEEIIARNFVTVGANLRRIRDEDLWRYARYPDASPWKSFEDYCEKVHELSKGYVSRLISAASIAVTMAVKTGIEIPTEPVATELKKVSEDMRVSVLENAALKAVQGGRPMTSVDIKLSRLEAIGGIPIPVEQLARDLGWDKDPDRMDVLLSWYTEGQGNTDSKFWVAYKSGVLDPGDGGKPVILKSASLREIHQLERRWQGVVIEISKDDPSKQEWTGVANDDLMLDGQIVRIANKRVKILVLP